MEEKQNWTYCVVGNIKKTHFDGGGILRHGTAAFTGGTKVYLAGRGWDRTTRQINALGMTRNKRKQIVRTDVSQIENIRLQRSSKEPPAAFASRGLPRYQNKGGTA